MTHAKDIADPNGKIFVTITSFPTVDKARSRPGHLVFAGSSVSIDVEWLAGA